MTHGKLLSKAYDDQIREWIRAEMIRFKTTEQTETGDSTGVIRRPFAVILNAGLPAGTFLKPTSATATRCRWSKADNEYTQRPAEVDVTVWNHSQADHQEDTPGMAIWCDGHLWFFADCDPMENRPAIPGGA